MASALIAENKVVAAAITGLSFFGLLYVYRKTCTSAALPLPPGPPQAPFVGNVFQMPKEHHWLTFAEWSKQYGKSYLNKHWKMIKTPN